MYEENNKGQRKRNGLNVPDFKNESETFENQSKKKPYVRQYENPPNDQRNNNIIRRNGYVYDTDYTENTYNDDVEVYESKIKRKKIQKSHNNAKEEKKWKLKRKRIQRRICWSLLLLIGVIGGHVIGRFHAKMDQVLSKINRTSIVDLSSVEVNESNLQKDDSIINILLVGSDKRVDWSEAGRSDSTMIATLDLKNKRLKITSLMRDMYVPIPNYGENKFNVAYSYGGVPLLYQTIAQNFDIKLDGFIVVDFDAFIKVINTIGGVKIELTDAEQKYLTTAYKKGTVLKLKKGVNNMNGAQALAYCRIRQDAQGDFGRTERQRKVMQSIFHKAKKMSFSQLVELAEEVMPYISTDLTNDEIISYLTSIIMLGTTEIDQMRLPLDGSFENTRIDKKAVLIPDLEVNKQALQEFIFQYNEN